MNKLLKDSDILMILAILFTCLVAIPAFTALTQEEPLVEYYKYDNITLENITVEDYYDITNISESYSKDGEKSLTVEFYSKKNSFRFRCEIPLEYQNELSKDAIYNGETTITYCKEVYADLLKETREESVEDIIHQSNIAKGITGIQFMYSDFIIDGVETPEELNDKFSESYLITEDTNGKGQKG